jgi:glycosyltransferase involved in cell wall biosynthesis
MRIVHVVPRGDRPWSGTLTVIVNLASSLAGLGHDVEVWHLGDWSHSDFEAHAALLRGSGVTRRDFFSERGLRHSARAIAREAVTRDIRVVHLHGAFNTTNAAVGRTLNTPFVFSPHSGYDPTSLERSSLKKRAYKRAFEMPMLRRAALVVALNEHELDDVIAFGAAPSACVVIPNGVARAPRVDAGTFRRSLGLNDDDQLALFVGRLDVDRKGIDMLLEGVQAAPTWHLALVGPDERDGLRRIRAEIASRRLGRRVHLCGPRFGNQLHEALASCDLFVLLSRWEAMPMALLEALSHGKPAVVSSAVERSVPVADAGAGKVADPPEVGRVLEEMAGLNGRSRHALSEAALRLAVGYEWPAVARRYEEAYGSVVGARAR